MKVKINSNFYIIIYFILMVLMNQSIGLSYINVISLSFLFISLKDINVSKCLPTKIYYIYIICNDNLNIKCRKWKYILVSNAY